MPDGKCARLSYTVLNLSVGHKNNSNKPGCSQGRQLRAAVPASIFGKVHISTLASDGGTPLCLPPALKEHLRTSKTKPSLPTTITEQSHRLKEGLSWLQWH